MRCAFFCARLSVVARSTKNRFRETALAASSASLPSSSPQRLKGNTEASALTGDKAGTSRSGRSKRQEVGLRTRRGDGTLAICDPQSRGKPLPLGPAGFVRVRAAPRFERVAEGERVPAGRGRTSVLSGHSHSSHCTSPKGCPSCNSAARGGREGHRGPALPRVANPRQCEMVAATSSQAGDGANCRNPALGVRAATRHKKCASSGHGSAWIAFQDESGTARPPSARRPGAKRGDALPDSRLNQAEVSVTTGMIFVP